MVAITAADCVPNFHPVIRQGCHRYTLQVVSTYYEPSPKYTGVVISFHSVTPGNVGAGVMRVFQYWF